MALQGNFATAIGDLVDSLTAAEIANINKAIWQDSFPVGNFGQAHTLLTGRRHGNLQPIVQANDYYGSMPKGNQESCALNSCDLTPNYSSKEWCLAEYNCRIPICLRTFDEDFLVFWNMYRQALENPLEEPDAHTFLDYLESTVRNQVLGTQWRVGYWGDVDATGNNLINGCDGFFVQAEAGSGTKIDIVVAGSEPTGPEIYAAFQQAYIAAVDSIWGGQSDVVWKTTYKMAARLVAWLNTQADTSQYNCDCIDPGQVVAARRFNVNGLRIFGVPVEAHREIDLSMTAAGATDPWRAILTRKSNLLIGTNSIDKMEGFDMFFDRKDRMIYVDSLVRLGTMIPLDDYVLIQDFGS